MEWVAFDALEPLDPAGMILKGLSGGGNKGNAPADNSWRTMKHNMMKHMQIAQGE